MGIERQYGGIIVVCDSCGECFMAGKVEFDEAIRDFKDSGGIISKRAGEWQHYCGDLCEPEREAA